LEKTVGSEAAFRVPGVGWFRVRVKFRLTIRVEHAQALGVASMRSQFESRFAVFRFARHHAHHRAHHSTETIAFSVVDATSIVERQATRDEHARKVFVDILTTRAAHQSKTIDVNFSRDASISSLRHGI
jgi:hypothetical protein